MRVRVLGSAAGGGFPQWNCGCPSCVLVREGDPRVSPRTQDSVAVSADGERWLLVNASPDVHSQIRATRELWPRAPRHSPIHAIVLTNGDLDHTLGLFSLRESQPLTVYATEPVWRGLDERNAIVRTLKRFEGQVTWKKLELGREQAVLGTDLSILALPAPGKLPVHLVGATTPSDEDNVGLLVRSSAGGRLAYFAASASVGAFAEALTPEDTLLFDGTFWSSDELSRPGLSKARAEDMAHLPIGGPEGSLARLAHVRVARRIYTHVNNTNPILVDGSPERRAVEAAGWELAYDGMEITL